MTTKFPTRATSPTAASIRARVLFATTNSANYHHHHCYRPQSKKSLALLFTIAAAVANSSCPRLIRAFSIGGVGITPTPTITRNNRLSIPACYFHHSKNPLFLGFGNALKSDSNSSTSNTGQRTLSPLMTNTRGGASSSSSFSPPSALKSTTAEATAAGERMESVKKMAASKTAAEKLSQMRKKMEECNVDVYLIPSDDPHLSEYVPAAYMRRGYLTDFHGSAGTALVVTSAATSTLDKKNTKEDDGKDEEGAGETAEDEEGGGRENGSAYLWTDSRYHNEASLRLDSRYWKLMKQGQPKVPSITKFLSDLALKHYQTNGRPLVVGLDAYVHSAAFAKELKEAFEEAAKDAVGVGDDVLAANGSGMEKSVSTLPSSPPVIGVLDTLDGRPNIVDSIWEGRPAIPKNPFRVQPMEYAGVTVIDKVAKIRSEMKDKKASLAVFSALDDIAYLFNVRCMNDIETCPVGIAYATISHEHVTLYCDEEKVKPTEVMEHLNSANVTIQPYEKIVDDIRAHLVSDLRNKVWLDSSRSNYALSRAIPTSSHVDVQNPITPMKACKNDAEMRGMRRAHIEDGAAMAEFMSWLENAIVVEGRTISEVEIDEVLTACRARRPGFMEPSFPTIAGVGSNGAIVHYRAAEGSDLLQYLDTTKPILIDSGGQYIFGTTDVTRTWHFGESPSEEFRDMYTRVLKGNIGVDTMIFPENTPGFVLDVLARKALWEVGKDYGHGTGHGVGAALNVHEGPHSISPRWTNKEVLKKGMVTSNEPGFYDDGNFGVRIENLLEIVDVAATEEVNGGIPPLKKQKKELKTFLKFAHLTQIPIQKSLINIDIMTDVDLDWLDAYHAEVLQKVAPLLEVGSPALTWLVKSCEKIERRTS